MLLILYSEMVNTAVFRIGINERVSSEKNQSETLTGVFHPGLSGGINREKNQNWCAWCIPRNKHD